MFFSIFYHKGKGAACQDFFGKTLAKSLRKSPVRICEDKSVHNEIEDFYAHMSLIHERRPARYFCRYSENIAQRYSLHKKRKSVRAAYKPKVLQQLCGHANMKTTMDRYVHATDASPVNAMRQLQQTTPPVTKKGVKRAYKKSKERRKPR